MFDADRPIQSSTQDRLNRAIFSKYLARCMLDHKEPDSFVIGLYGGWGGWENLCYQYDRRGTETRCK